MPPPSKSRQLLFLFGVYVGLPGALVIALLFGWIAAVENATLVLQSADSPDGRYRAEFVRQDPGASSSYKYMVRVNPSRLSPLAEKLRSLPFGPMDEALELHREPDKLTIQWTGPQELTIHCEGCAGATPGKPQWRDVHLIYDLR